MLNIVDLSKQLQPDLVSMRRHFHTHPELNRAEHETSKYAAKKLSDLGFCVRNVDESTGLIAEIGDGKKLVAIRCDMDALPVQEQNRAIYASKNDGVMHACGHDAHLACVLGAAQIISQLHLPGRLRLIIQPGDDESGEPGIKTMIKAGALEGVCAVLGLHVDVTIPTGKIAVVAAPSNAVTRLFRIEFQDALEDTPCLAIADTIRALYDVASKSGAKLRIKSAHSDLNGEEKAVNRCTIYGDFDSPSTEGQLAIQETIQNAVLKIRNHASIKFEDSSASTVNSSFVSAALEESARSILGASNVLSIKRKSWNYQFSLLTERAPGAMFYLGAEISSSRRSHQSSTFDIDENCLSVGTATLVAAVAKLLSD